MSKKVKKNRKKASFIEIYGIHSVRAALKNDLRKHERLIINRKNINKIDSFLIKNIPTVSVLSPKEINNIYGNKQTHQGIILKTSILEQPNLDEVIKNSNCDKEVIVMLDHVNDPHNIGNIMRSCALYNCRSIIVSKDHSPDITSAITKVASGALEIVNYIKVVNLSRAIEKFKRNNYWIVGLDNNSKIKYDKKFEIPRKCLLILGSESKGLRQLTKKQCDEIKNIPMKLNYKFGIESLNVSSACTVALYEHFNNTK